VVRLFTVFSIICSLIFLAVPFLERRYELSGSVAISIPSFLANLPQSTLAEFQQQPASEGVRVVLQDSAAQFSAIAPTYNAAWTHLHHAADQFAIMLNHRVEEQQRSLQSSAERLAASEQAIIKEIDAYRLTHHGMLGEGPNNPNSVQAQFDKIRGKLDDQRERLQFVTGQIVRLRSLKAPVVSETIARPAEHDPEVMTIRAQMQLLDEQLAEQLGTMQRTERHPYVVALRAKESELKKKLEIAQERVAAGRPPSDAAMGNVAGKSNVELQLEILLADQETLEAQVKRLTSQRDQLQKQVDELLPIRREFEKLTDQLASVRKERETVKERDVVKVGAVGVLGMGADGTLPRFPRLIPTYVLGIALAAGVTMLGALVVHKRDHAMHTLQEVSAAIDLPILGVISDIRSPAQRQWHRLWRSFGRPGVVVVGAVMMLGSAVLCYYQLSNDEISLEPRMVMRGLGKIA